MENCTHLKRIHLHCLNLKSDTIALRFNRGRIKVQLFNNQRPL